MLESFILVGRFSSPAQDKAILPVHDVGMKLNLIYLSDDPKHVSGFGGEALNVLKLDIMPH